MEDFEKELEELNEEIEELQRELKEIEELIKDYPDFSILNKSYDSASFKLKKCLTKKGKIEKKC